MENRALLASSAGQTRELEGVKVCRDAPVVTNLWFADDSLILMKTNERNVACLKSLLDRYCSASGQIASVDKSSIFFSPSTELNMKAAVYTKLNIMTEALNDKYLGLPATLGLDKSDSFQYLIDCLIQRLMGWKEKCLSLGCKEILLKYVAQAIQLTRCRSLKFLKEFAKESQMRYLVFGGVMMQQRKRCNGSRGGRCVYQKSKEAWGLGISTCFNLALLAKQAWRLIDNPKSLCAVI